MTVTVIKSVLLFDGHDVIQNATVQFDSEAGTVKSVSDSSQTIPSGAIVVDGSGHTLIPGLIDGHIHAYGAHMPAEIDLSFVLKNPLQAGITTICDMHSDPKTIFDYRDAIKEEVEKLNTAGGSGKVTLTDLKSCLYAATIEGGWPKAIVLAEDSSEETKKNIKEWPVLTSENAPTYVENQQAAGADYIKLMQENCGSLKLPTGSIPSATLELQTDIVNAAHAKDMLVVGHATSVECTEILLNSGADGLTHTMVDQDPPESIINLHKQTGAFVIPTLVVLSSLSGEEQELRAKFAEVGVGKGIIDDFGKKKKTSSLGMAAPEAVIENAYQSVRKLRKAGVDIVAGTDSVPGLEGTAIGLSLWMELEMYVKRCGMTPVDALKTATSVSAKRFRFHDRGSVEPGKRADLVLVKGDPTQNIGSLWEGDGIVGVWKQGLRAV